MGIGLSLGISGATFPTLANTLKGPTYLEFNLPRLPNRTTPFQGRSFPLFLGSIPDQSDDLFRCFSNQFWTSQLSLSKSAQHIVLILISVPKAFWNDLQKFDVNLPSRSQMIETGIPCLATILFRYNLANLSNGSFSLIGKK
nr:hypothetical protein [Tanacetum cinerariifolium]